MPRHPRQISRHLEILDFFNKSRKDIVQTKVYIFFNIFEKEFTGVHSEHWECRNKTHQVLNYLCWKTEHLAHWSFSSPALIQSDLKAESSPGHEIIISLVIVGGKGRGFLQGEVLRHQWPFYGPAFQEGGYSIKSHLEVQGGRFNPLEEDFCPRIYIDPNDGIFLAIIFSVLSRFGNS